MKKISVVLCLLTALVALTIWATKADARSSYFASNCATCHTGVDATCNGCHAHGIHSTSAKSDINVKGATNKTAYSSGETVSVTITGGYRTGWIRAILYDQNMAEMARSTGPDGTGGGAAYPITLTAPAPTAAGTYTWSVSWYGNQYDGGGGFFQPTCSSTLTTNCWKPSDNPNHGEEIVSTNSFTVAAAATPKISLNPAALDLGTVTVGSSVTLRTLVRNTGGADLVVSNIALCTGTSTEYTWSPTAVPITIPAGGSVTLSVIYKPINTDTDTGCLNISSNDPVAPTTALNLTGIGSPVPTPRINLSPSGLDHGTVTVGGSATKTTLIQNLGNADLVVSATALCTGTSAEFSSPTAVPITIPAGGSATLSVIYAPTDAGADTGCLNISSNDPVAPTTALNLTGIGSPVPTPRINLSPSGLDFGTVTVGNSATKTTLIQNLGNADLVVSTTALCTGTSAEFSSPTAVPITIPAGGSATLSVIYAPTDAGADTGCLNISSNDPATSAAALSVTGTGFVPEQQPKVNLNPAALDLGTVTVGGSATKTTLIQNLGGSDLIVDTIALCTGTSAEFSSPTAVPITIPAGGSATLSVIYAPTDAGADTGCLNISSNDPAAPVAALSVTGAGSVPTEGADFDIMRFMATRKVDLSRDEYRHDDETVVKFRLSVMNKGTDAGSAPAKLVGMQGTVEVYNQTIAVSALAGGSATFTFPPYSPTAPGAITWTVTITDPTPATATATTIVVKRKHEDRSERED